MAKGRSGLGRGIEALFGEATLPDGKTGQSEEDATERDEGVAKRLVPLEQVYPNPDQPRSHFDAAELEQLAESIQKNGLLQPIVVRPVAEGYQIIAGERRWRACQRAGLAEAPVTIVQADDDKAIELALIENIQRSDLNPIEEAYGYRQLMERESLTQAQLAGLLSKGRSTIANALRLLELPDEAQRMLLDGTISAGHARAILSVQSAEGRERVIKRLAEKSMTVRETESYARLLNRKKEKGSAPVQSEETESYRSVVDDLGKSLNTKVKVTSSKEGHWLQIRFSDSAELERIVRHLEHDHAK